MTRWDWVTTINRVTWVQANWNGKHKQRHTVTALECSKASSEVDLCQKQYNYTNREGEWHWKVHIAEQDWGTISSHATTYHDAPTNMNKKTIRRNGLKKSIVKYFEFIAHIQTKYAFCNNAWLKPNHREKTPEKHD